MKISFHQSTSPQQRHKSVLHELWVPQVITRTQKWPGCQKPACFPRKHQNKHTQRLEELWLCDPGATEQFQRAVSPQQNTGRINHPTPQTCSDQILAGKMKIFPAYGLSPGPLPFTFCTVLLRSDLGQNSCNKVTVRLLKVPKLWQQFCFLAFCATLPMNPECPSIFSRCSWVKFPAACPCPDT